MENDIRKQPDLINAPLPSDSPEQKVSKSNKKWLLIGLIVILVIVAYYLGKSAKSRSSETIDSSPKVIVTDAPTLTPSSNQTSSNFTYISKYEPKVSFTYPSDEGWSVLDNKIASTKGYLSSVNVNYTLCGPNCGLVFAINVYDKGSIEDPGVSYGETQMSGNSTYKLNSKSTVSLDGVIATRWEFIPSDSSIGNIIYYYLSKANYSYVISINSNGALNDDVNFSKAGDEIVKSIKFL